MTDRFTAGVQFVSLASITQPDLVATALADALELQKVTNRTIPQLIGDQLQNSGPFLLLLDNFEQVLPAATVVAETFGLRLRFVWKRRLHLDSIEAQTR
jgi:predicted ATPase